MDKAWLENKRHEHKLKVDAIRNKIEKEFFENEAIKDYVNRDKHELLEFKKIRKYFDMAAENYYYCSLLTILMNGLYERYLFEKNLVDAGDDNVDMLIDSMKESSHQVEDVWDTYNCSYVDFLDKYLDSEPMFFDGDIIITDPCYVMNHNHDDDWDLCNCGNNMSTLGIQHWMTRDTLYGDWSCTVKNTDIEEVIGHFCADSGQVSVFLLSEILKYNPLFDDYLTNDWTTTLVKDFCGTVQFVVQERKYEYKEATEFHEVGDVVFDYVLQVVGRGKNKVTGEPLNFVSYQSGF